MQRSTIVVCHYSGPSFPSWSRSCSMACMTAKLGLPCIFDREFSRGSDATFRERRPVPSRNILYMCLGDPRRCRPPCSPTSQSLIPSAYHRLRVSIASERVSTPVKLFSVLHHHLHLHFPQLFLHLSTSPLLPLHRLVLPSVQYQLLSFIEDSRPSNKIQWLPLSSLRRWPWSLCVWPCSCPVRPG